MSAEDNQLEYYHNLLGNDSFLDDFTDDTVMNESDDVLHPISVSLNKKVAFEPSADSNNSLNTDLFSIVNKPGLPLRRWVAPLLASSVILGSALSATLYLVPERSPKVRSEITSMAVIANYGCDNDANSSSGSIDTSQKHSSMPYEDQFLRTLGKYGERSTLVIDKEKQTGRIYRTTYSLVDEFNVSTGLNPGEKKKANDMKTNSGSYIVQSVEDSRDWVFQGKKGVYGNYFLRLNAGEYDEFGNFNPSAKSSIGVHGTDEPDYLGIRKSHGCIRIPNEILNTAVSLGYLGEKSQVAILSENNSSPYSKVPQYASTKTNQERIALQNHVSASAQSSLSIDYQIQQSIPKPVAKSKTNYSRR